MINLVSVIVPNLNSPIVGQTLASLSQQDYPWEYEIIVVGQDKYGQVQKSERIHAIVTPTPIYQSAARNIGIREAKGEILAFIDSDCIASPEWLHNLIQNFENPDINVVGGGVTFPSDHYWTFCDNVATFHEYLNDTRPGMREQLPTINLGLRSSIIEQIGFFDEQLPIGEDVDLTTRMRIEGLRLYFDPTALITHLSQRRNISSIFYHAFDFGRYSRKLDPRYSDILRIPWPLRRWWTTLLLSPLLASGVIWWILFRDRLPPRYWITLPVVWLTKLIWCLGATITLLNKV